MTLTDVNQRKPIVLEDHLRDLVIQEPEYTVLSVDLNGALSSILGVDNIRKKALCLLNSAGDVVPYPTPDGNGPTTKQFMVKSKDPKNPYTVTAHKAKPPTCNCKGYL